MNKLCNLVFALNILHFITTSGCRITNYIIHCQNHSLNEIPQVNITGINSIYVDHNSVSGFYASDFEIYKDLVEIHANNNNISYIGPGSFFSNKNLKILVLENNVLSHFNSSGIFSPHSVLQVLNLRHNKLSEIDISSLECVHLLNLEVNGLETLALSSSNMRSLKELYLGRNHFKGLTFPQNCYNLTSSIKVLDVHDNYLKDILFLSECRFSSLLKLNLAQNDINYLPQNAFLGLINLNLLILDGNPITSLGDFVFSGLYQLKDLHLNNLSKINHVASNIFCNLSNLYHLELQHGDLLQNYYGALKFLSSLQSLDLSGSDLADVDMNIFMCFPDLKFLNLSNVNLKCDCSLMTMVKFLTNRTSEGFIFHTSHDMKCKYQEGLHGLLFHEIVKMLNCSNELEKFQEKQAFFKPGSRAMLSCEIADSEATHFVWMKVNAGRKVTYFKVEDPSLLSPRHYVTQNGSLIIENLGGSDVGLYECYVNQERSSTFLKLDYEILKQIEFESMLAGLLTSVTFLLLSIFIVSIRICCKMCSQKEKEKKTSMREVLTALRTNFQSDRFQSYKLAQMERFTAFRSATLEQISAFKSAKVSQLTKYKQASVNGILHCLEKMRIHYSNQSLKIKVHCQQQFDKLRESYVSQRNRLRDNRSLQVKRIREHYHTQALRIKGYGVHQMYRLRGQYKIQQQNLMKLLELLEVGNCLHVIEAECSRTESMIFDSEIVGCNLESQPNVILNKASDEDDNVFDFPPLLQNGNYELEESLLKPFFDDSTASTSHFGYN